MNVQKMESIGISFPLHFSSRFPLRPSTKMASQVQSVCPLPTTRIFWFIIYFS
jgi:hypothetical protein